jgi:hypothetical protein
MAGDSIIIPHGIVVGKAYSIELYVKGATDYYRLSCLYRPQYQDTITSKFYSASVIDKQNIFEFILTPKAGVEGAAYIPSEMSFDDLFSTSDIENNFFGSEVYLRNDSALHNYIKNTEDYSSFINVRKPYLYFGKLYPKDNGSNKILIETYSMKDYALNALPEHQRTDNLREFLGVSFDMLYYKLYGKNRDILSLLDPYETPDIYLKYILKMYDMSSVIYDTSEGYDKDRFYISNLPGLLKRKGTYTDITNLYRLVTNSKNLLNIYEQWHEPLPVGAPFDFENISDYCVNSGKSFIEYRYNDFYGETTPLTGAGERYYTNTNVYPTSPVVEESYDLYIPEVTSIYTTAAVATVTFTPVSIPDLTRTSRYYLTIDLKCTNIDLHTSNSQLEIGSNTLTDVNEWNYIWNNERAGYITNDWQTFNIPISSFTGGSDLDVNDIKRIRWYVHFSEEETIYWRNAKIVKYDISTSTLPLVSPRTSLMVLSPHYKVEIDVSTEPFSVNDVISNELITMLKSKFEEIRPVSRFVEYNEIIKLPTSFSGEYVDLYNDVYYPKVKTKCVKPVHPTMPGCFIYFDRTSYSSDFQIIHGLQTTDVVVQCFKVENEDVYNTEGVWSSSSNLDSNRAALAGCGTQTAALTVCGYNLVETAPTTITEKYNGTSWESGGETSIARYGMAMGGTQIAAITTGGHTGSVSENDNLKYDGVDWTAIGTLLMSRHAHGCFGTTLAAVVVSGLNNFTLLSSTEEYNGTTWVSSNNVITARQNHGGVGLQDTGLIFGGYDGSSVLLSTELYNGVSWSAGSNMNVARTSLAGGGTQTNTISFGGLQITPTIAPLGNTEKYDGVSWINGNDMNIARYDLAGAGVPTSGLSFGGRLYGYGLTLNTTEEYNLSTSVDYNTDMYYKFIPDDIAVVDDDAIIITIDTTEPYDFYVYITSPSKASDTGEYFDNAASPITTLGPNAYDPMLSVQSEINNIKYEIMPDQHQTINVDEVHTITFNTILNISDISISSDYNEVISGSLVNIVTHNLNSLTIEVEVYEYQSDISLIKIQPKEVKILSKNTIQVEVSDTTNVYVVAIKILSYTTSLLTNNKVMSMVDYVKIGCGDDVNTYDPNITSDLQMPLELDVDYEVRSVDILDPVISLYNTYNVKIVIKAKKDFYITEIGLFNSLTGLPYNKNIWYISSNIVTSRHSLAGSGTQTAGLSFGGVTSGSSSYKTEKYDGTTWTAASNMIVARHSLAGAGTQTATLAFGGYDLYLSFLPNTERYNGTSWITENDMNIQRSELSGCGTVAASLSFGGRTSSILSTTEIYNGSSWTTDVNLNTTRYGLSGAGTTSAGLSFGGYDNISYLSTTEEYNSHVWSICENLNTARFRSAGTGTQTSGLYFGGYNGMPSAVTEEYNGISWSGVERMNVPRYSLAGCGTQEAGLSFGGFEIFTFTSMPTTEEYSSTSFIDDGDEIVFYTRCSKINVLKDMFITLYYEIGGLTNG